MDRTDEFLKLISYPVIYKPQAPSPFLLTAIHFNEKILKVQMKLLKTMYDYIDYDRHIGGSNNLMNNKTTIKSLSADERNKFDEEIQSFIVSTISAMNDMKSAGQINTEYRSIVFQDLQNRTSKIGKTFQIMQRLRKKYNLDPLNLFHSKITINTNDLTPFIKKNDTSTSSSSSSSSSKSKSSSSNNEDSNKLPSNFVDRYVSEIASIDKLKTYDSISDKQRQQLFAETNSLRERFSEEAEQAEAVGENVASISNALGEFLEILASQEGDVEDVNVATEDAHEQVKIAEQELNIAIERTKSSSLNMALFMFGMAMLLLLIDFLSP